MMWDWEFALDIVPQMLGGVRVTLTATFYGTIIAAVVAVPLLLARRSRGILPKATATAYIYLFRGTPLLIQFYFAYYVFPLLGLRLPAFVAGAATLGLNYATYFAETYRSGIQSVPRAQWEAARALSFSPLRTWVSVVIPQALRPALPALGNHVNLMFKMSALMAAISVLDIFGTAINIGNTVYRYLEPVSIAGLFYLAVSVPVSFLIRRAELRQARSTSKG